MHLRPFLKNFLSGTNLTRDNIDTCPGTSKILVTVDNPLKSRDNENYPKCSHAVI